MKNHNQIVKLNEWIAVIEGQIEILQRFAEHRSCAGCKKIIEDEWIGVLEGDRRDYRILLEDLL